ncbi:C39 family peptidase [Paraclostridium bifermentans]|uniref:C39 family peptidase n=1 Tax=Paraclostridium bifermentans TaxID=1490 RepID=UPI00359C843C
MKYIRLLYNKKFKNIVFLLLTLLILGLIYITYANLNSTKAYTSNKTTLSDDEKMVMSSKSSVIKDLVNISYSNPEVDAILSNLDAYPSELLELASKNKETLNFVTNYPKNISNINKSVSIEKDYVPGKIPLFLQWDERWGYDKYGNNFIALNGCAPTSLAMVAVGLTGNTTVTPKTVADYSFKNSFYVNGVGSSWQLISKGASYFGLKSKEIPLSKSSILSSLKRGNPVIVTVGPGTFTSSGHFLVLTGVDNDGRIKINDPNSKFNSSKTWNIDVFLKESRNLWEISKM